MAWLRQQPQIKHLPVVVLTSSQEDSDMNNVYDLGKNAYMVKPIAFVQLVEIVAILNQHWLIFNEKPQLSKT